MTMIDEIESEEPKFQIPKHSNFMDTDYNFYICGEFDDSISRNIIPNLSMRIEELSSYPISDREITFYINSPGGYIKELYGILSLFDIARTKGIRINTVIIGEAYSCGSLLAIHGDHRSMFKYARHLMHLGQTGEYVHTFKQIERTNDQWKEHFENIVRMYKDNTKMSEKDIREKLSDDLCWINAEDCKKLGLVDEIIGDPVEPPEVIVKDGMLLEVNGTTVKIRVGNPQDNNKGGKKIKKNKGKKKDK